MPPLVLALFSYSSTSFLSCSHVLPRVYVVSGRSVFPYCPRQHARVWRRVPAIFVWFHLSLVLSLARCAGRRHSLSVLAPGPGTVLLVPYLCLCCFGHGSCYLSYLHVDHGLREIAKDAVSPCYFQQLSPNQLIRGET